MLIDCISDEEYSYSEVDIIIKKYISLFGLNLLNDEVPAIVSLLPNSIDALVVFYAAMLSDCKFGPCHPDSSLSEFESWVEIIKPDLCIVPVDIDENIISFLEIRGIDYAFPFRGSPSQEKYGNTNTYNYSSESSKLLLKTSGTTGDPKAMCLAMDVLWSSAVEFVIYNNLKNKNQRFYNFLPMSYLGGLFNLGLIPIATGGSVIVDDSFSAKTYFKFWPNVSKYKITVLWLTPSIMNGLLKLPKIKDKSIKNIVKICFLGMAPSREVDKKLFLDKFEIPILENYGLSETTFISADNIASIDNANIDGAVGEVLDYVDINLLPVDIGDASKGFHINVKTPFLFDGYIDKSGGINLPLDENGYFPTGDIGYVHDGKLRITGREKDFIKKGGYLISLREIEVVAEGCSGVLEAAAVVSEHEFYGEVVKLYIVPSTKNIIISENVRNFLANQLAGYKVPDEVILIDQLPKTISGKIKKYKLDV